MNEVPYGGIIIIDFSNVDFLYPSGLNTIVCTGINLLDKNRFIKQIDPKNREVSDFLDYSGFRDIVGIGMRNSKIQQPDTTYKIHSFDTVDDNEISKLVDVIEKELNMSLSVKNRIHENIAELIMNTVHHSESKSICYVIGQAYPTSNHIRYCIADAGIGIKEHLSRNNQDISQKPTSEVIELATEYGVTGNPKENSGIGLNDLKELVYACGGSFRILSEDGFYEEEIESDGKRKTNMKMLDFNIHGTFIDVLLNNNPEYKIYLKDEIPNEFNLLD